MNKLRGYVIGVFCVVVLVCCLPLAAVANVTEWLVRRIDESLKALCAWHTRKCREDYLKRKESNNA